MSTMNQDNLKLWIADLRTTEAPQTIGALHDIDGFCCMGRLCEVAIKNGVDVTVFSSNDMTSYDSKTSYPPPVVKEWLGYVPDYVVNGEGLYDVFAGWNDDYGLTFAQIADRLEAEYVT